MPGKGKALNSVEMKEEHMKEPFYSDGELITQYRQAKDKGEQIGILADFMGMTRETMREKLRDLGCDVPAGKRKNRRGAVVLPFDELRAMELYREGVHDLEIAEALGVPKTRVTAWRQRMRLPGHYGRRKEEGERIVPALVCEQGTAERIATASVRTGLAMTGEAADASRNKGKCPWGATAGARLARTEPETDPLIRPSVRTGAPSPQGEGFGETEAAEEAATGPFPGQTDRQTDRQTARRAA